MIRLSFQSIFTLLPQANRVLESESSCKAENGVKIRWRGQNDLLVMIFPEKIGKIYDFEDDYYT